VIKLVEVQADEVLAIGLISNRFFIFNYYQNFLVIN